MRTLPYPLDVSEQVGAPSRRADAVALAIVALVFALPLRGLLRAPGPPMEEGFMLVFPELVLHGAIPNKDFLHLYGPGSLWALAGAFKVFGVSLLTERLFGLGQQVAIVFGVYAIARRSGRVTAVCGAVTSALIIIPFGLTALAWVGGVGLGVVGLAAGLEARGRPVGDPGERSARRFALAAGLLLGLAVLFRLDLVIAVGLSTFALSRGMSRPRVTRLLAGIGVGVAPYVIQVATAGLGNSVRGMVLDPVFHLRGGRGLPIPPPWSHVDGFLQRAGLLQQLRWPIPSPRASEQLFLWFFLLLAVVAFLVIAGWRAVRADPASLRARALLVGALFSLGCMPQALQRVDSAHFAWVSSVPFGLLPVAFLEVARRAAPWVSPMRLAVATGAAALALVIFVLPAFTATRYADYALQTFDVHRHSYKIEHDGRIFYYGKEDRATAANLVVAAAAHQPARPTALRRARRPSQDPVQRRLPLLPVSPPRAGDVLHRDGPGSRQRRRFRARQAARVSRHRDPLEDLGQLERAERLAQVRFRQTGDGARPRLLPRRHLPEPVRAVSQVSLNRVGRLVTEAVLDVAIRNLGERGGGHEPDHEPHPHRTVAHVLGHEQEDRHVPQIEAV